MLDTYSLNMVKDQLAIRTSYIGDDMSKKIDLRMDTCSTCDGSCSGSCDDSCDGYCSGCGNNG